MEFHKVLVPVDFSPCSFEAYHAAVTLARQFKAELLILHVIDNRILESLTKAIPLKGDALMKGLHTKARLRLRSFLSEHPSEVKLRRIIAAGVPFHEIVRMARLEQVDLIVMGRYGDTGELEKIFFGSTAEKVVRVAPCAVLSIPLIQSGSRRPAP
jgi:nucleotide-binding universal stress UspA family protein